MNFARIDRYVRAGIIATFIASVALAAIHPSSQDSWVSIVGTARTPLVYINGKITPLPAADYLTSPGGASFDGTPPTAAGDIEVTTINGGLPGTVRSVSCGVGILCAPSPIIATGSVTLNITPTTCGAGQAEITTAANGTSTCAAFTPGGAIAGTLNTIAMFTPDGSSVGNSLITQSGTIDTVGGTLAVNTSGQADTFSTYHGANSDGDNIWIGGGGLSSVGSVGDTTFGAYNTSAGFEALLNITTGNASTAIGYQALRANTVGNQLTAVGYQALVANTTGNYSTAFGFRSLFSNTSGSYLTAIGYEALSSNTTGIHLAANGYSALAQNVSGSDSVGVGYQAFFNDTTGSQLTGVGSNVMLDLNITANDGSGANTAIGYNTGRGIVTGVNNTIIGANVTGLASSLSGQIIIADGAGNKRIQVDSSAHTTLAGNVQIMATGATWTSGTGVPAISCAIGDEFSRTDGGVGTTLYTCTAINTWTALSSTTGTVTGTGTANTTTKWTAAGAIGNAWALDDGTNWGVSGAFLITESTGAFVASSTAHIVGAITADSTLTTTQASIGTTSLAGGKLDVVLTNATTPNPGSWDGKWATFGSAAGSTGPSLGIGYNTTGSAGAYITAVDPGNLFEPITFTAANYAFKIGSTTQVSIVSSGALFLGNALNKGAITLAGGTGTATVTSGSVCVCTDRAGTAGVPVAVSCSVTSTTLTANGIGTDPISYICL